MMAIPAIDLREGACVQLVGGAYEDERVRRPDPVAEARRFVAHGFRRLHVVDLDAATGRGDNAPVIEALLEVPNVDLQIGGGVRSRETLDRWLDRGASAVVVGTKALEDPTFLRDSAERHPGRVAVALDVRGREVLAKGWAEGTGRSVEAVLEDLGALPLAFALVTAVHVEGSLAGVDRTLYEDLTRLTALPIVASGGVGGLADLDTLEAAGAHAAVIGMALYVGRVDPAEAAKRFATWSRGGTE
jgi:phosphoribosylformimino-5-aminoimidazole carboxamide ribotide isomerase